MAPAVGGTRQVPIMRFVVYWGLYWGTGVLRKIPYTVGGTLSFWGRGVAGLSLGVGD